MKDKLIISLAINGRENYEYRQLGLIKTLSVLGDCDSWILNAYPEGVTPHTTIPYLFKFDLIKKAVTEGYKKILWADSTMRILKDPFELLKQSGSGVIAFDNLGHPAWKYCTDKAAENLKYCYTDIKDVKQTWGGCFLFDFGNQICEKVFNEIIHQASIGSFDNGESYREGFVSARHDQTTMSFIFHFYNIPLLEYGVIASKSDITEKTVIQYGD